MSFTNTAKTEYFADDLANIIDLPLSFKGCNIAFVPKATIKKSVIGLPKYKIQNKSIETINSVRRERI